MATALPFASLLDPRSQAMAQELAAVAQSAQSGEPMYRESGLGWMAPFAQTSSPQTPPPVPPAGGLPPVQTAPLPPTPPMPAPPVSAPTAEAPVTSPTFVEPQPASQQPAAPAAPETPAPETPAPAPAPEPDPAGLGQITQKAQQFRVDEQTKRLEGHSIYTNTEKRLAEIDKGRGIDSWLPTAIAWAALLQGQPGLLMKLQEQKRQTQTMRELAPLLGKVREMRISGDYAGASDMLGQIVQLGGNRAPELMPYLMQASKELEARERDSLGTKFAAKTLKRFIERDEASDPTGKRQSQIRPLYDEVHDAEVHNTPIPPDILKEMLTRAANHIQLKDNTMVSVNPLNPSEVQVTPIQAYPTVSQIDTPMAQKYAASWGISVVDLNNLMLGKTIQTNRGPASRDDQLGQAILSGFNTQVQPTQADLDIAAKNLRLPPELVAAALKYAPWIDVLTGKAFVPGYVPGQPDVYGQAQTILRQNDTERVMSQEYAKNASDPTVFQRTGQVLIVANPGPGETLGQLVPDQMLTIDQVKAAQGRYRPMNKEKYENTIVPAIRAYEDLGTYADFQASMGGGPTTLVARLAVGAVKAFQDKTGITLAPKATVGAAAEAYVDRAIEQSLKFIPRTDANVQEIGRLKDFVKGKFADTAQGEQAITYIKQQLLRMIHQELGGQFNQLPGAPGIGVTPPAPPAVPPTPSAGTAGARVKRPAGGRPGPGAQVGSGSTVDVSGVTYDQIMRDPAARAYFERWHGYGASGGTSPYGVKTTPEATAPAPTTPAPTAPAPTAPAPTAPAPAPQGPQYPKPQVPGVKGKGF